MATFGQLQQYVSSRLLDEDNVAVQLSDVKAAINDAIAYWKVQRYFFNEARDTAVLTQGDGIIPLPNDFLVPARDDGGFEIEYSSMRYPLSKVSAQQYDGYWLANGNGLPQVYARLADEYHVYPLPDIAYTIRRNYLKDYPALVGDADTNDFTIHADRLIRYAALADLYGSMRQDVTMEGYYANQALAEDRNLKNRTAKSNATGGLTIHSIL
jgi:hypothetical protein